MNNEKNYSVYEVISNETQDLTKPIISVITPYYDNKGVSITVKSVLEQDYPNIEYIIADDFSKNPVMLEPQILIKKNILSIRIQRQKANVGTVRNLNDAIQEARGEYIYFLSADDVFCHKHVLTKWTDFFQKEDILVCTAKRIICKDSKKSPQCIRPTQKQIRSLESVSSQELYKMIAYKNYILGCCTAYSKRCFEKYGYFDENYRLLEDHPKVLELLKENVKIGFFNEMVIYYIEGGVSAVEKLNLVFEQDVERLLKNEAAYLGDNEKEILLQHRLKKRNLIHFFKYWSARKYIKAAKVYPQQAIKEFLKPLRSIFVKNYIHLIKMIEKEKGWG